MSWRIKLGNFLYKRAFFLYRPLYNRFKKRQDAFEISLLKEHIENGAVVLDIGANIGFYASILADLVGEKGRVHCFEPDRTNFRYLQQSVGRDQRIQLYNAAVGANTTSLKIYLSDTLNVDHRTYEPEHYERIEEISCLSIDEVFKGQKVDFIKMDIQGYEHEALKGMVQTLENNPRLKIISEFWPYGLNKAGSSAVAYFDKLSLLGFKCALIENNVTKQLVRSTVEKMNQEPEEKYYNILAWR
jgi:FkbM family methyltransferase